MKILSMKTSLSSSQKPNKLALQPMKACKTFEHFQLWHLNPKILHILNSFLPKYFVMCLKVVFGHLLFQKIPKFSMVNIRGGFVFVDIGHSSTLQQVSHLLRVKSHGVKSGQK